ncbi:MAG: hypothetical protein F6J90_40105 [Moorea sp. SIOASIH]|uniref:hypothetical protein n=1 Tax=Moorena sp. SIOASIH TaxID=2607817 RepID=UPI0013BBEDB0|nr:hypothetical protein [Moorena sp. SIOASIH]NEO42194.1 hypothetical protein [Moorena sp. SIOASIH]
MKNKTLFSYLTTICFSLAVALGVVFTINSQPAFAGVGDSDTVILKEVVCITTSNHEDIIGQEDDVVLNYFVDEGLKKSIPSKGSHEMTSGDVWVLNQPVTFKKSLRVELLDKDTLGTDSLGNHTYMAGESQPQEVLLHGHNDSEYILVTE